MSLPTQIKIIYPEITDSDFIGSIILQDDGNGAYIKTWDHPTLTQPTDEQLAAVAEQSEAREASELNRKIWPTVADFYAEFTSTEKYAIQSSNVPAIVVARGDLAMWRGDVWSDNVDVLAGLDAMVEAGVITAERKIEILKK